MVKHADPRAAEVESDPRWALVVARDQAANGNFYYAVKSTGVYCLPSCGSRTPRPENVHFFLTALEAQIAGFRPCKRCRPDLPPLRERQAALVARLCRQIEVSDTPPSLNALAHAAQMSASHIHRMFRAITGLTPRGYAAAHRARKVQEALARSDTVTNAIYAAGYNSSGRFYEESGPLLGMKPKEFRAGGANTVIRFAIGQCSLGAILVAASDRGICAIFLGDEPGALARDLQDRFPNADLVGGDARFEQLVATVVGFVETPKVGLDLPLDIQGTAFQQRVWSALRKVPTGTTVSYSELARRIGMPKAARAVAGACAANALAVVIPCHRVVRDDGSLSGYRWGVDRKRELLERETDE